MLSRPRRTTRPGWWRRCGSVSMPWGSSRRMSVRPDFLPPPMVSECCPPARRPLVGPLRWLPLPFTINASFLPIWLLHTVASARAGEAAGAWWMGGSGREFVDTVQSVADSVPVDEAVKEGVMWGCRGRCCARVVWVRQHKSDPIPCDQAYSRPTQPTCRRGRRGPPKAAVQILPQFLLLSCQTSPRPPPSPCLLPPAPCPLPGDGEGARQTPAERLPS